MRPLARLRIVALSCALAGACAFDSPAVDIQGSLMPGDDSPCRPDLDDGVVALYSFDDGSTSAIADSKNGFDGVVRGGTPGAVTSMDGCGMALEFPATGDTYVEIPDHAEFHLAAGAIELLVRTSDFSALRGILSRDAVNIDMPGHFTLFETTERRLALRMQETAALDVVLCSNQVLEPNSWTEVAVNLGSPVEMFVNGEQSTTSERVTISGGNTTCGSTRGLGIEGNANPWAVGAAQTHSSEGQATPVTYPFHGGAVDHLRISNTRRDFTAPAQLR